jgi:hypothetical protein
LEWLALVLLLVIALGLRYWTAIDSIMEIWRRGRHHPPFSDFLDDDRNAETPNDKTDSHKDRRGTEADKGD